MLREALANSRRGSDADIYEYSNKPPYDAEVNEDGIKILGRSMEYYPVIQSIIARFQNRVDLDMTLDVMGDIYDEIWAKIKTVEYFITKDREKLVLSNIQLQKTLLWIDAVTENAKKERTVVFTHQVYFHPGTRESQIAEGLRRIGLSDENKQRGKPGFIDDFIANVENPHNIASLGGHIDHVKLIIDTRGYKEIAEKIKENIPAIKAKYGDRFDIVILDDIVTKPSSAEAVIKDIKSMVEKYSKSRVLGIIEGTIYSRYVGLLLELRSLDYFFTNGFKVLSSGIEIVGDNGQYLTELDQVVESPAGKTYIVECKSARTPLTKQDVLNSKILYKLDTYKKGWNAIERGIGRKVDGIKFVVDVGHNEDLIPFFRNKQIELSDKYGLPVDFVFLKCIDPIPQIPGGINIVDNETETAVLTLPSTKGSYRKDKPGIKQIVKNLLQNSVKETAHVSNYIERSIFSAAGQHKSGLFNPITAPQKVLLGALDRSAKLKDIEPGLVGVTLFNLQNNVEKADIDRSKELANNGLTNIFVTPVTSAIKATGKSTYSDGPVTLTANGIPFTVKIGKVDHDDINSSVAVYIDFAGKTVDNNTLEQAENEVLSELYKNTVLQNVLADYGAVINPQVPPIITGSRTANDVNPFILDPVLSKSMFAEQIGSRSANDYIQMLGREQRKKTIEAASLPGAFSGAWMDLKTVNKVASLRKHIDGLNAVNGDILRLTSLETCVGEGKRFSTRDIVDVAEYARARNIRVISNYAVAGENADWQNKILEMIKKYHLYGTQIDIGENSTVSEPELVKLKHDIDALVMAREKDFALSSYISVTLPQNYQYMAGGLKGEGFEIIKIHVLGQQVRSPVVDEAGVRYRLVLPGEDEAQTMVINPEAVGVELAGIISSLRKSNIEYNISLLYGGLKDGQINSLQESRLVDILSRAIRQKLDLNAPSTSEGYFLRGMLKAGMLSKAELSLIKIDSQGQITGALSSNSAESFAKLENSFPSGTMVVEVSKDISNIDEKRGFWSCALGSQMVNSMPKELLPNGFAEKAYYPFLGALLVQSQLASNAANDPSESGKWNGYRNILTAMKSGNSTRADVNSQLKTFMSELMPSAMAGTLGTAHANLGAGNYKEIISILLEFSEPPLPSFRNLADEAIFNAEDITIGTALIRAAG